MGAFGPEAGSPSSAPSQNTHVLQSTGITVPRCRVGNAWGFPLVPRVLTERAACEAPPRSSASPVRATIQTALSAQGRLARSDPYHLVLEHANQAGPFLGPPDSALAFDFRARRPLTRPAANVLAHVYLRVRASRPPYPPALARVRGALPGVPCISGSRRGWDRTRR